MPWKLTALSSRLERGPSSHGIARAVPEPKSLLDVKGALLIAEIRLNICGKMVEIESTTRDFEQDHHGLFLCPVDVTGLAPSLSHSITEVSGLRQEYLVEVFKRVIFVFTSSQKMKLFSEFVRAQFNLNLAQVPYLRAQVNIFHTDSFPQGVSPRYRMIQIAHGLKQLEALWVVSEPLIPWPTLDDGLEALEIEALSSCGPDGRHDLGRLGLESRLDDEVSIDGASRPLYSSCNSGSNLFLNGTATISKK
ncbi:hypothetical protein FACUT_9161 [Fusarium acutatum]|uniref:Uncharacterized protein n=1 Tax=Fusarium acutatum TaxID=78861 RepID=A0A8H4NH82_9HYPO|nr:hypothetical protein FACUT_9161 [Fusarium acutatum]